MKLLRSAPVVLVVTSCALPSGPEPGEPSAVGAAALEPAYCSVTGASTSYEWLAEVRVGDRTFPTGRNGGYLRVPDEIVLDGTSVALTLRPGFGGTAYQE
jgi:hypothetical protein